MKINNKIIQSVILMLIILSTSLILICAKQRSDIEDKNLIIDSVTVELKEKEHITEAYYANLELSVENIFPYLLKNPNQRLIYLYGLHIGVAYPDVMAAQSIIETGWFENYDSSNVLGFQVGTKNLSYNSWFSCVDYYKDWQNKNRNLDTLTREQYIYSLNKQTPIYAEDKYYHNKINVILTKLEHDGTFLL